MMTQSTPAPSAARPASPQAASTPDKVPGPAEVPTPDLPGTSPDVPVEPDPAMPDPGPEETPEPYEPDEPLGPIETPAPDVGDRWDANVSILGREDSDGDGIPDAEEVEQPESIGGTSAAALSGY